MRRNRYKSLKKKNLTLSTKNLLAETKLDPTYLNLQGTLDKNTGESICDEQNMQKHSTQHFNL